MLTRRSVASWRVNAKTGISERTRDIQSGVEPDSVKAMIAVTSRWFATYMTAIAMASSTCENTSSRR